MLLGVIKIDFVVEPTHWGGSPRVGVVRFVLENRERKLEKHDVAPLPCSAADV